jgi:hypothetical protein
MTTEQLLSKIGGSLDIFDFPDAEGNIYSYCYFELTGSNDYWNLISFADAAAWSLLKDDIEANFDDIDLDGEDVSEVDPIVKMWPVFLAQNQFQSIRAAIDANDDRHE